ncbi:ATP-dependent DNA ligase [Corallococcus interemptor]|uniref:DNA ligase (ATP) n=1 Tax=Corallococcus interemptor TaxID=2316720 RepID=A0A3A8PYC5_9BACT|nr:ATP-dependent DNA ligase [Corallococcus interemptor]RKH61469.1 ATP-dependent DNA ligase [Corallococcus interemptor]
MRALADLYDTLDQTTSTNAKVDAMARYFRTAPPEDAAWGLFFLTGQKLKRLLTSKLLAGWTMELTGVPDWLFDEVYASVGDLAEVIALLLDGANLPPEHAEELPLSRWLEERLLPLRGLDAAEQRERVVGWWKSMPRRELFLLNKMLTGELRVGVSNTLVVRAIAQVTGLPPPSVAHRLMGTWTPTKAFFEQLVAPDVSDGHVSRPYPYYLASPLEQPAESLGELSDWLVEWKWDGIRGQLIRRQGDVFLWSRGEELLTERFPEITEASRALPEGTVLDGEVMAYEDGTPLPFARLQRRIGRQKLTPKVLAESPAAFIVYDLLEQDGKDLRELPLRERRARLEALLKDHPRFPISPSVTAESWEELAELRKESRTRNVEGLMLKRLDSVYQTGRKRGDWWKWKIDPYTVDAVLLYAHPGHGRRSSLYTDYTFAVWNGEDLLPVTKAYSGLTDEEIGRLDRWIRAHTREKFGPVRSVDPEQVFELHFEAIAPSPRHKSGIALRFPRIARWRADKTAKDADTLDSLKGLLHAAH